MYKRLIKNALLIFSGEGFASLLGLVSFGLLVRSLNAEELGNYTLILSTVVLVDKLFNFQSWQALIQYGSSFDIEEKKAQELFNYGITLDVISAIFAFAFLQLSAHIICDFFNLDREYLLTLRVYGLVILFNIEGMPTAVFRLQDKFSVFAYRSGLIAIMKLTLFVVLFYISANLHWYLIGTLLAQIAGSLYFVARSGTIVKIRPWHHLSKSFILNIHKDNPGLLKFLIYTNFQSSTKLLTSMLDVFLVSKFLGNTQLGYFQVVKQVSRVFTQMSAPLYKAIYPEFTKLVRSKRLQDLKTSLIRLTLVAIFSCSLIYFGFLWKGEVLLRLYAGEGFSESFSILKVYLPGVFIFMSTFPLTPALLALNKPQIPLLTALISSAVFLVSFILGYKYQGSLTIGYSYTLMTIVWLFVSINFLRKNLE